MTMLTYDQEAHQRLVKDYMSMYHSYTKEFKTGSEVHRDKYGDPIAVVGFISVVLKDDADILADLAEMKNVRVRN
jgi:hypothetical protein